MSISAKIERNARQESGGMNRIAKSINTFPVRIRIYVLSHTVNWLIPTLQGVYPAGQNTFPAHKRECFPPISDSSAPTLTLALLSVVPHKNLFASGKVDYSAEQ